MWSVLKNWIKQRHANEPVVDGCGIYQDTFPIIGREDEKAIRPLPHPRTDPGLYERPGGRRDADRGSGVGLHSEAAMPARRNPFPLSSL